MPAWMTSLLREDTPLPMPAVFSATMTEWPRSASARAQASPTTPAPMTRTSIRRHSDRLRTSRLRVPWIRQRQAERREVADVACHEGETPNLSGRRQKPVHQAETEAVLARVCHQIAPAFRDRPVDRKQSPLEARRKIFAEPPIQRRAPCAGAHERDAAPKFRNGDYAEKDAVFINLVDPMHYCRTRSRPRPFRNDVGVQEIAHSSMSRGSSFRRSRSISAPRSGELAKNSAKLPFRLALRSHSSAETTSAAVRPFFVMV